MSIFVYIHIYILYIYTYTLYTYQNSVGEMLGEIITIFHDKYGCVCFAISSNVLKPDIQISAEPDLDTLQFSEEMNVEEFQSGIRRLRGEAKAKDAVISRGS